VNSLPLSKASNLPLAIAPEVRGTAVGTTPLPLKKLFSFDRRLLL
jgi:hypothetical protein